MATKISIVITDTANGNIRGKEFEIPTPDIKDRDVLIERLTINFKKILQGWVK